MPSELLDTLTGGGLTVAGVLLGTWWTTRHAARDRHRRACQEMLRQARRIQRALRTEETRQQDQDWAQDAEHLATGEQDPGALMAATVEYTERYEAAQDEVDHLTDELAILALDLRGHVHRQAVGVCVDALHDRMDLPPPPARIGRRAMRVVEKTIEASLDRRAWWKTRGLVGAARDDLNYLSGEVADVRWLREEQHRDQKRADEEWARQQRARRESGALGGEGDGT